MSHNQKSDPVAQPEDQETVLVDGVVWIVLQKAVFICKNACRFVESHLVLAPIGGRLPRVPSEFQLGH
jgi:hypothetical protein